MSYIRPLSNPEGLYIIGAGGRGGHNYFDVLSPVQMRVPIGVVHRAVGRWSKDHKDISYRGFRIKSDPARAYGKVSFSYHGKTMTCFSSTWLYIVARVLDELAAAQIDPTSAWWRKRL